MAQTALYRAIKFNDGSGLEEFEAVATFYDGLNIEAGSIAAFMQVEELLFEGDYATAATLNDGIEPSVTEFVEANYKLFYSLYATYLSNIDNSEGEFPEPLSDTDSTSLYELTQLCPGTNGACIFQARALYNSIYNQVLNYPECELVGARMAANANKISKAITKWSVNLFPNPASDEITIVSKKESEYLKIAISDLSGRLIKNEDLKTSGFYC